jgi:predicted permease
MKLRSWALRLRSLFQKRKLDRDLDNEIAAHLEMAELDALATGKTPEEARQQAQRQFGAMAAIKEEHRDRRSLPWIENMLKDLRFGLFALSRDPGFAIVTISLLALGIGANAAMFTLVDGVLLKPLPFAHPERMVRVWESPPDSRNGTTTLTFLDWKRQTEIFESLSAESLVSAALTGGSEPVRVSGKLVSADYFDVFAVKPKLGRAFLRGEDQPGAARVAVISNGFWHSRFAGDPEVLGRDLNLDGEPYKIIGVLPPGSFDRDKAAFWAPLIFAPSQMNRGQHWLDPIGRLREGVSLQQAQSKMTALRRSLDNVIYQKTWGFAVDPFATMLVGDTLRRSILLVFAAVACTLLIACANVANLVLTKGATRQREMAIRTALGASRGRLIAQLVSESLVLCLLGGVAGIGLGALSVRAATPLVQSSLPFTADLKLDWRVLVFSAGAILIVLLLTGLLPALRTSFGKISSALNQAGRGFSASNATMRQTIVVLEVATSVVLICGAALLLRSLSKLQQVNPGVQIDHIVTASIDLPSAAYSSPDKAVHFYETLVQRLQAIPGVERASVSQSIPLQRVQWGEYMYFPGVRDPILVRLKLVDAGYLETVRIPLINGRGIEEHDRAGTQPVVLVNQELARQMSKAFGLRDAVGRTVGIEVPGYGPIPESMVQLRVVGVIGNERTTGLNADPEFVAYLPLAQVPRQDFRLLVRTRIEPSAVVPAMRTAVQRIDPNLALDDVFTMEQVRQASTLWARQPTWVIGIFAGVAAVLSALGIYGVLAHAVAQQRREIGIRIAIGASSTQVLAHIFRNAFAMLTVGVAGGLAGAFLLARFLQSLLFQISTSDTTALGAACVLMILLGSLATWIPASRAAHVDPATVLRNEG